MSLVPDFDRTAAFPVVAPARRPASVGQGGTALFWATKACVDVAGALFLVAIVTLLAVGLLVLNPIFNPGPLFFRQRRMGRDLRPFEALKFRTMAHVPGMRGPDDPVETDRIPPLGRVLRRMGLDELPQAVNVLRGEMSLIGPRPDVFDHAAAYAGTIPEYRQRHRIKPGMSGLAQVTLGYAVGTKATRAKALVDLDYIARAGFALDLWITWRTILMVVFARGD